MEVKSKVYKCFICKKYMISDHFYKDMSRKSGVSSKCKPCLVEYKRLKRLESGLGDNYGRSENKRLEKKLKGKLRQRIRHVIGLKRASNSDIGCSAEELIKHLESQFKSGMSWDNHGNSSGKWVIDHIRPIADFIRSGDDIKKANHYSNLQPLWWEENLKKSDHF